MAPSEFVFVYSTFPDAASARRVAESLIERRLAACVNIHGPMTSLYEWEGKLTTDNEFAAFIKTTRAKAEETVAAVRSLHPYSVPCFLVLPIDGGNEDYIAWARSRLGSP